MSWTRRRPTSLTQCSCGAARARDGTPSSTARTSTSTASRYAARPARPARDAAVTRPHSCPPAPRPHPPAPLPRLAAFADGVAGTHGRDRSVPGDPAGLGAHARKRVLFEDARADRLGDVIPGMHQGTRLPLFLDTIAVVSGHDCRCFGTRLPGPPCKGCILKMGCRRMAD